uniref:HNH nuclease domain-containing protein n=1 Tax=viral metagenome TaxID=1070528 RepID=A0A6C0C960_9ZZZZ
MSEFCPVVGYEDRYGVSKDAMVTSFKTNKIMKTRVSPSGYKMINLYDCHNNKHTHSIHILVAKTYLKKTNLEQIQVDHIDGNKLNNNLNNLRFVTPSENSKNAHRNNKNITRNKRSVCKLDINNNILETYESVISAARNNNLYAVQIINCCKDTNKTLKGHRWIYQEKNIKNMKLESDEIFKKIDEIDGMLFDSYEISSYGKVRNIKTQHFLAPEFSTGYVRFQLCTIDHIHKHFSAHRIVAYFFIRKENNPKMVVNHIDENKMNNHFTNLEWSTYSENTLHSVGKKVCKIDKHTGKILYTYSSATCASKVFGKSYGGTKIGECCNNKSKTTYGYIWKYLEKIIGEMIDDGYIKIAAKELSEYPEETLVSFITNAGQLRYGRVLVGIDTERFTYTKDEERFSFLLSNVKEMWIKENVN